MIQAGKHPGKTNLTDVDNGANILQYLSERPAAIILKHNNPCGAAWDDGGVAAALVGAKVAKSPKTRELCVAGMAKGMKLQQDARVTLQNMKEDAQDLCAEAKQKAAQETAEEA